MEREKILQLLGIANRAGKIVSGYSEALHKLQQEKIQILFVATDASEKTKTTFENKCKHYQIDMVVEFSTEELSHAIGKEMRKIVAVTDLGFYKTLKEKLSRGE